MRTYNFNPILKGLQDGERALAAIQMIGNGTIKERAYAMTGATASTVAYMTKLGVASASELTFIQKLRLSTMALWEQAAAWAASPLGMATLAAVGIFALVKIVDLLTTSLEESREALANLKEEYTDNENELTTLNDELQTTIDRINELQGKDSLTFTEAEELDNLRRQNTELERQIALLETIQKQKNKEMNQAFVETMEKDLGNKKEYTFSNKYVSSNYSTQFGTDTKKYGKGRSVRTMSERDLLYSALVRYNELYAEWQNASDKNKEKIKKDLDDVQKYLIDKSAELASDAEGISYISNPTEDYEKESNNYLDFINDFNDKLMITMGQSGAKENALNRLIFGSFSNATSELKNLGKQGEVTAKHLEDSRYDAFIQKCIDLGIIADDSESSLAFLALAFNKVKDSAESSGDEVSDFKRVLSGINSLDSGLSELGKIYEDISNKGDFDWNSILDNEAFTEAFGSLGDEYDDFIRTVSNSPKNISACQNAFNDLATKYVLNSNALNGVTNDTRDATVAMLEQMGVANAASIVDDRLAYSKAKLKYTTGEYVDMEYEEILALYNECAAGSAAKQVLAELAIAKMMANGQGIYTSSDIEQLIALANAANATSETLSRLAQAKSLLSKSAAAEANGMTARAEVYAAKAKNLLNQKFDYNIIDPNKFKIKFKGDSNKKESSKKDQDSWFEKQLAEHKHLVAMEQETTADYLDWLSDAYPKAYKEGIISLDEFYQYQQEVFEGLRDVFMDSLSDVEHEISMRENYDGEDKKIIQLYEGLIDKVEKEIEAARDSGLTDEDDYIQKLQKKWQDYTGAITDLREEITNSAKDALDELIDYRIDMLKQEVEDEKDALDKKLDNLKEFYDKQKEMLQDQKDEEDYLEEQSDKRKNITDLQAELAMLENDDSAWAQKRKLELKEEISSAQDELDDFEKDHALDAALDALDKAYNDQEAQLQAEMDALEEKLNDPEALYNKALADIRKNSENQLYYQMLMYNRQFGDGNDATVKELWESAFGALSDYEKLFGKLYNGVKLGNKTGVKDEGGWDDEKISGTNPDNKPKEESKPKEDKTTKAETKAPPKKNDIVKVKKTATHFGSKSGGKKMAAFVPGGTYSVYKVSADQKQVRIGKYSKSKGWEITGWVNLSDIVGYKSGTPYSVGGLAQFDEEGKGSEYIFESSDGSRYRMFGEGSKVLNADATNFLYEFATSGGSFITKMLESVLGQHSIGDISKAANVFHISSGDIIVQGNATERTVSEIRRAQRENLEFVIKEFNKLNK